MRSQAITVTLPDEVYQRVKRNARGMKQPVPQVLVRIVEAAIPSLAKVPPEYRAELEAMETMSDADLWKVTKHQIPASQQRRLSRLLHKNQRGVLSTNEHASLARLRTETDRWVLRRSYAYLLLKYRGHQIPTLAELTQ